jgi:uncharacterized protein YjbI with pentapeptide repeats
VSASDYDLTPGTDLSGLDLSRRMFEGFDFTKVDLRNINFTEVDFRYCVLNKAAASGSDFTRAGFYGSDLKEATLVNCVFEGTVFYGSSFEGADFTNSYWHNTGERLAPPGFMHYEDSFLLRLTKSELEKYALQAHCDFELAKDLYYQHTAIPIEELVPLLRAAGVLGTNLELAV